MGKPLNYGTVADPIAGLDVIVTVTSHGLFRRTTKSCTMTVRGDGTSVLGNCETGKFVCAGAPTEMSTELSVVESKKFVSTVTPDQIVEIGKVVYQAVKDNQPVINVATDWAGAVPKGITNWADMENWETPVKSQPFKIEFRNGVGLMLTNFEWTFAWKYGGSYQGVGNYVTQAGIQISDAYGYLSEHLDVSVQSLNPLNYGSVAGPVAGIDIIVSVTSHGLFKRTTKTCTMTVKGDGTSVLGNCATGKFVCSDPPLPPS